MPPELTVASLMSAGQASTGVSLIVTEKVQVEVPHALVAVHVTVLVPVGKLEPDDGTHATVAAGVPLAVGSVQAATWLSH